MKKGVLLGLASLFILTGCGNKVVCTGKMDEAGMKATAKITATIKSDKVSKVSAAITFDDKQTAETYCGLIKAFATAGDEDMDIKCSGKTMNIGNYAAFAGAEDDEKIIGMSKADFIKAMEKEDGVKCK